MNKTESTKTVPIFAMIIDFSDTSIQGVILCDTIKKLYKLANSSLPGDRQLILPIFIFTSELASDEGFCKHWYT